MRLRGSILLVLCQEMDAIRNIMTPQNLILPRLWLGNVQAATDDNFLRENNINVVFNCTKDLPFSMIPEVQRRYRLPVDDNLEDAEIRNMELWAPEAVIKVVEEYHVGSRILIHCAAGMQRSAALVAMSLMVMQGIHADEAMAQVKQKRPVAFFPAANFKRAIHGFDNYFYNVILPHILNAKKNE